MTDTDLHAAVTLWGEARYPEVGVHGGAGGTIKGHATPRHKG